MERFEFQILLKTHTATQIPKYSQTWVKGASFHILHNVIYFSHTLQTCIIIFQSLEEMRYQSKLLQTSISTHNLNGILIF